MWPIVSKVTAMLSSGLVDSHALWVLSIPFTWLRHRNQWECSGFESSRNTAYMTIRPFAVHLYTRNSICSVVQSLLSSGPWHVVSWHLRIRVPVLFCFTIAVWVESVVQRRTGKHAVYFRYWCYPVICLEALKATTIKPQNTLCQGWESKLVPPEQERQLITHHDLRPWWIFSLFNYDFELGSCTTSNGGLMCE